MSAVDDHQHGSVESLGVSGFLRDRTGIRIVPPRGVDAETFSVMLGVYGPSGSLTIYTDRANLVRLRDALTAALDEPRS